MKLNWKGSDWTLSTEGDTGSFTALSMTTVINQLSALMMAGFTVSRVVLDDTSIQLLGTRYAPDTANKQRLKLNKITATGLTSGSASIHYNPLSREWTITSSTNTDGDGSQVDSVYLQEYSSLTSMRTEAESSSSRCDMNQEIRDVSRSLQDARRRYMEENALRNLVNTSASQREVETQSSSECAGYQQLRSRQPHQVTYYGNSQGYVSSDEPFLWRSPTVTTQGTNYSTTWTSRTWI